MADARDQRGTGDRPNVLNILCDQLRRDLLGAYGGTLVRTPDLDAPLCQYGGRHGRDRLRPHVHADGNLLAGAGEPDDGAVRARPPHVQHLDAALLVLPAPAAGRDDAGDLGGRAHGLRDGATAKATTGFLRSRDGSRPFLAFCALPGPHAPWRIPHEFGIRYDPGDIPVWANRHDTFEGKPLAHDAPVVAAVKGELAAEMGRSSPCTGA